MIFAPRWLQGLSLVLALTACRHGRCYRDTDCGRQMLCREREGQPLAAPARRCGLGEVRCVEGCQARCTEDSCSAEKVCGEGGCCERRPCKLNNDCPREESCVDNKCQSPGHCTEPGAEP